MYNNKTIIISCAGMGKRLGMEIPKALVEVDGKPLIVRNLELLKDCSDIRIVVGYKAEKVIEVVKKIRKDVVFVFNHNYMNNGTGASVSLAARYANEYIITIDGDLLIHPDDMKKILDYPNEFVGVCKPSTDKPVLTKIVDNRVTEFSYESGVYEWTGVSQFKSSNLIPGDKHVFHLLEPFLPMDYLFLRTKEIDTKNDYDVAVKWVRNNYSDNITIGIVGGMGSVATVSFFSKIVSAFPAEKEWDRPRIIIDNRCNMPSRVRAALYDERRDELVHSLMETINMLVQNNCDYVILACNTSHIFLEDIYLKALELSNKIVNIIDLCAKKIASNNVKNIKLLASEGTILSKIYHNVFSEYKIEIEEVDDSDFQRMRNWIEAVKQQKIDEQILMDFVDYINNSESNDVVLGCTELPVLYDKCSDKIIKNIYDPLDCAVEFLKLKQNDRIK